MWGFCQATEGELDFGVIRTDEISSLGVQKYWGTLGSQCWQKSIDSL